ncbi:MAG: hypothetical protein ACOZIN_16260 [Myxococcota bacterium]
MKVKTLAVLVAVLGASSVALGFLLWAKENRAPQAPMQTISAPPSLPPAIVLPCNDKEGADNLSALMRSKINPAVTRISYAIHHDTREKQARMEDISTTAGLLLGCVRQASLMHPQLDLDRMSGYYALLDQMQGHAFAIQVSALELDAEGAAHWFMHLKQDCVACHARFRLTGELSQKMDK